MLPLKEKSRPTPRKPLINRNKKNMIIFFKSMIVLFKKIIMLLKKNNYSFQKINLL